MGLSTGSGLLRVGCECYWGSIDLSKDVWPNTVQIQVLVLWEVVQ